jgi:hypothetical protein
MNPALKPVIFVIAAVYLAADEVLTSFATPIANWLARLRLFARMRDLITSLPPYPSLALFLIPIIVLEPLKLVATYLAATGRFTEAAIVFVVGITLKLVLIERLFALTRDKLMTIPAFVWCYVRVRAVHDYFEALPVWKATKAKFKAMKIFLREFVRQAFAREPAAPK